MTAVQVQVPLDLQVLKNTSYNNSLIQVMNKSDEEHIQENFTHAPMYLFVCVTVFNILEFIIGTFGNAMVILVVCKVRAMRNPTNYFLFSLSVADLFVLLICQPTAMMEFYAMDRWYLGGFMCKLVPLLENGMLHVSIMTIIAVTTERYIAICYPFKKQAFCSDNMAVKVIVVLWLTGYACTSPFLVMTSLEEAYFFDGSIVKVCRTKVNETWQRAFVVATFVVFFALPFFLLFFMYGMIIRQLMSDSLRVLTKNECAKYTHRSRKQVVRMLIFIIILFFVSLCPIRVVSLWQIFTPAENLERLGLEGYLNILSFARLMMYLNSSMNPVIYSLTSSKFKLAFKRVLRRSEPRRSTKRDYPHDYQHYHLATESTTQAGGNRLWKKKNNDIYMNKLGRCASGEKMLNSEQNHVHSV